MILVQGKVTDETGQGLPYANVFFSDRNGQILDTNQGTTTDENGNFGIQGNAAYITASYVGYQSQTKPFKSNLEFQLSAGIALNEVEVIGTTEKPVKNNTGLFVGIIAVAFIGLIAFLYLKVN